MKKPKLPRKLNSLIVIALIGLVGIICAVTISSPLLIDLFTPQITSTLPSAFTPTPPSKTPQPSISPTKTLKIFMTSTETRTVSSTVPPTALATVTSTDVPISMLQKRNGLEFTFQIQNIPSECDQVTCDLRWMVWEGSWIGGNPNNGAEKFRNLRYDSGWKKADDEGLTFVISIPNSAPGKPYFITFQICTDSSRSNCKTASGQYSYW